MQKKVCCFGELLLRLSPALNRQWLHDARIPAYLGGAELNVTSALANWQVPVKYCTALPDNYLAREICDELHAKNIGIDSIVLSGNRIGAYYLAQGTDLKQGGVIYDRAHSSFSELRTGMINWDEVLEEVGWFHFSAISPALNENVAAVCLEAAAAANARGITVSIDLNYRAKLWQYGKQPVEVVPALAAYCNLIMGNIWSANSLLGIPLDASIHQKGSKTDYLEAASAAAAAIFRQYPQCRLVANTFRFDHNAGIRYYAALNDRQQQYVSKEYATATVIDKVGSGDCFMAGLLFGLYNSHAYAEMVDFAAAAAFGKLQEFGDATHQTTEQVRSIINSQ